jgi:putative transposase
MRVSRAVVPEVPQGGNGWTHGEAAERIVAEAIAEKGAWLVEWETMPDNAHLLVEVDLQFGIHRLVKAIKGRSPWVLRPGVPMAAVAVVDVVDQRVSLATVCGVRLSVIKHDVEIQKSR